MILTRAEPVGEEVNPMARASGLRLPTPVPSLSRRTHDARLGAPHPGWCCVLIRGRRLLLEVDAKEIPNVMREHRDVELRTGHNQQ